MIKKLDFLISREDFLLRTVKDGDDTLSTRLNIFKIMKDLNIEVLNYENTR